jgi:hypothetical protein
MVDLERALEDVGLGALPKRPYPGLRPFFKEEWRIFFGREKMASAIIDRLIRDHLVFVHGDSGSGKSSVVRAGVLAALEQEHDRSGNVWRTQTMMPGNAPLANLAEAIANFRGGGEKAFLDARRVLNLGHEAGPALVDFLAPGPRDYYCILVDQFEELFDFVRRTPDGFGEACQFTDFLVGLARTKPERVFVMATMRSEYLGACARFPGLAEAVNESQYLLPPMSDDGLVRTVREPAFLYGLEIPGDLARGLILQAGSGQDQLPLLQHSLLALYEDQRPTLEAAGAKAAAHAFGPVRLTLKEAPAEHPAQRLSDHADQVLTTAVASPAAPGPVAASLFLLSRIFRALIDLNADHQGVRRRLPLAEIAAEAGTTSDMAGKLIAPFRMDGVSFLRPYGDDPLEDGDQVEISHESLIRQWRTLAGWLREEAEAGAVWRDLLRSLDRRMEIGFVSGKALESYLAWMKRNRPTPDWAERYGGRYGDVKEYLDESLRKDRLNRLSRRLVTTGAVTALVVAPLVYFWLVRTENDKIAQRTHVLNQRSRAAEQRALESIMRLDSANTREREAHREAENAQVQALRAKDLATRSQALARKAAAGLASAVGQEQAARKNAVALTELSGRLIDKSLQSSIDRAFTGGVSPTEARGLLDAGAITLGEAERVPQTPEGRDAARVVVAPSRARLFIANSDWYEAQGTPAEAESQARLALDQVAPAADGREVRLIRAEALTAIGRLEASRGRGVEAKKALDEALHDLDGVQGSSPDPALTLLRAKALNGMAAAAAARGDGAAARRIGDACAANVSQMLPLNLAEKAAEAHMRAQGPLAGVGQSANATAPEDMAAHQAVTSVLWARFECLEAQLAGRESTLPAHEMKALNDDLDRYTPLLNTIDDKLVFRDPRLAGLFARLTELSSIFEKNTSRSEADFELISFYDDFYSTRDYPGLMSWRPGPTASQPPQPMDMLYTPQVAQYATAMSDTLDSVGKNDVNGPPRLYAKLLPFRVLLSRPIDDPSTPMMRRAADALIRQLDTTARALAGAPMSPAHLSVLVLATEIVRMASDTPLLGTDPADRRNRLERSAKILLEVYQREEVLNGLRRFPFFLAGATNTVKTAEQLCKDFGSESTCSLEKLSGERSAIEQGISGWNAATRKLANQVRDVLNNASDKVAYEGVDVVACKSALVGVSPGSSNDLGLVYGFDYLRVAPNGGRGTFSAVNLNVPKVSPDKSCRLERGFGEYATAYGNKIWLFVSKPDQDKFLASPDEIALTILTEASRPSSSGLESGQLRQGKLELLPLATR